MEVASILLVGFLLKGLGFRNFRFQGLGLQGFRASAAFRAQGEGSKSLCSMGSGISELTWGRRGFYEGLLRFLSGSKCFFTACIYWLSCLLVSYRSSKRLHSCSSRYLQLPRFGPSAMSRFRVLGAFRLARLGNSGLWAL